MALVMVATLVLTALAARKMVGPYAWIPASATFAAGAIMLYPVAVTRYDAVVAFSLAVAAFSFGGRYLVAYASLGFGAAAKLVPALATLPLAVFRRGAARGYAAFFAVLALFFVPALILGGGDFAGSFAYHADRGLQIESFASSVLMQLGRVSSVVFAYGAFEAQGPDVGLASSLSFPIMCFLLLVTALFMYGAYRRGAAGPGAFPRYAAALILAFMLGSKVLSPQFVIWLLPLVPLSVGGVPGLGVSAVFLAACFLTTQVYPIHYDDLLNLRSPGPQLLLARNLLLAFLWGLMLFLPGNVRAA
jgi:hypothetical protein